MDCPSCGHTNPSDAAFCGGCAAPLGADLACPVCGRRNRAGQRFCNGCAAPLTTPAPPPREPRAYTPRHLADRVLSSRSALEGERKQVTVLFADVKGSMKLAEQVGPEEWHRILDRFFEILSDGVHRFEGTVNQYTGDGIMALFGAPLAHEDHAQRACYAALHLRDELREFGRELRREHGLDFSTRIGLNSGDVVVGKIGDDLRMDYTAQGHTVGLAQRIEQLAEADKPFLTEHTAALVRGYFRLEDLGDFKLKGVGTPVRAWGLEGPGELRSRLDLSRERGFSKFVGRAHEMATLEAALERAEAGSGQVVGIVADAGVGKSRLCHEFAERCRAREIRVSESRCPSHGQNVPLLTWMDGLRSGYAITDADSSATAREKIAGRTLVVDETLADDLPLLFDFLGVPDPQRPAPRLDPQVRQRRLLDFTKRFTRARSRNELHVVCFEDLHWIDPASEAFMAAMIDVLAETATLLVVNFRPEYRAEWMSKSYYQQISLAPLGADAARELVSDLVGEHPSTAALPELLQERTRGNPFFTEEIVQSLAESGQLTGERGAYRLASPIQRTDVPRTVQAVLAARIDRLPEREKRVLQTAAVIGAEFSAALLADVAELPEAELAESLAALQRAELVHEGGLYPDLVYRFKHPLTQQVAHDSQLADRRRRLHTRVARALEATDPERRDERAALLAHHHEAAGDALAAAREHLRAARWLQASDRPNALEHWRKVAALAKQVSDGAQREPLELAACEGLLTFTTIVPVEEAAAAFAQGRRLAQARGDRNSLARLLFWYANRLFQAWRWAERVECVREAESIVGDTADPVLQFTLLSQRAWVSMMNGDVRGSLALIDEALARAGDGSALLDDPLGRGELFGTLIRRVLLLSSAGRLEEGARALERALRVAHDLDDPIAEAGAHMFGSSLAQHRLDAASAFRHAHRLEEIAQEIPSHRGPALACLGIAQALAGSCPEAVRALRQGMADSAAAGVLAGPGTGEGLLWALLGAGETDAARDLAEEQLGGDQPWVDILANVTLARLALESEGAPARHRVEQLLQTAAAAIERTGARVYAPRVCEVRAQLARLLGDAAGAERELREAQRLFAEMGAPAHVERLARELATLAD